MAQSPWTQGDTRETWDFSLETDSGDFDTTGLTTSNFTYYMRNISNGIERQGDGTFSGLTAASGNNPASITYQQSTNDVANLGMYEQDIKVTSSGKSQTFNFGILEILPS